MDSPKTTPSPAEAYVKVLPRAEVPESRTSSLTPESFERCRQILIATFRFCSNTEFQQISSVITCVLTAVRLLHISEIQSAVVIYSEGQFQSSSDSRMTEREFAAFIQRYPDLLQVKEDETVSFRHAAMAKFLQSYRIRGIDKSHRTLAMVCKAQRGLDRSDSPQSQHSAPASAIGDYAEQFCQYHCELATRTCLSLDFDMVKGKSTADWVDQFAVLQVEDDWVHV